MARVLFIGDVVGRPGREVIASRLPALRASLRADLVVANCENAAAGSGLTGRLAHELLGLGIDAITLGDHVWDQRGFEAEIGGLERVCRPANLPAAQPGRTHLVLTAASGFRLGVFTVLGRVFVGTHSACPFLTANSVLEQLRGQCDAVLAEIHAEATSEKVAFGRHLEGRAALVVGTHTHIPTADARVLAGGTAYLTDAGMTGPYDSVLGREVAPVLGRYLDGLPRRFEIASGDVRLCGACVEIDAASGRAVSIERVEVAA
jgi:metallophosphoesterase (TIGR00282 family)